MKIGIDNGHGQGCANGSPDGRLKEWSWAREVASEVYSQLKALGYDVTLITPEQRDIPINTRVARVNKLCHLYGKENVLVVSIHADAQRYGKRDAYGWSCLVADTASAKSRQLANCLYDAAAAEGRNMRRPTQWQKYWERDNVGILTRTLCPAVLTESGFMTNEMECEWLLSDEGKRTAARIHVEGIIKFLER